MNQKEKKHLTLNIDSEIANKAVADPNIKVSEITEKFLQALTTISKKENEEKIYDGYQKLFKIMLPLLQKFQVRTEIAAIDNFRNPSDDPEWSPDFDPDDNVINDEPIDVEQFNIFLLPDGKLDYDGRAEIKIKDIHINAFHRPQEIIDNFLDAIQEGVNYRKEQFTQIEMAKTIIDVITKGTIPKSKSKGKRGKRK